MASGLDTLEVSLSDQARQVPSNATGTSSGKGPFRYFVPGSIIEHFIVVVVRAPPALANHESVVAVAARRVILELTRFGGAWEAFAGEPDYAEDTSTVFA